MAQWHPLRTLVATYTQQTILRKLVGRKNSIRGPVFGPHWPKQSNSNHRGI